MPDAYNATAEFRLQLGRLIAAAQKAGVHITEIAATLEASATAARMQRAMAAR